MGWFSLSIDTNPARTILPTAPEFKTYKLHFIPKAIDGITSNTEFSIYRTPGNLNTPVLLYAGRWDLIVTAYTDEGDEEDPPEVNVASGSFPNNLLDPGNGFLIGGADGVDRGTVTLRPITEGKGTFSWTINYPSGLNAFPDGVAITSASMAITSYATDETVDPPPTLSIAGTSATGGIELAAGYYRVNITLTSNNAAGSDEKTASLMQILHIYTNMVSEYTRTFTASNFSGTLTGDVTIDGAAVDGTAALGDVLTANTTALSGSDDDATYYQWKRNGVNIPGERNKTYTVKPYIGSTGDPVNMQITVEVYRAGYNGSRTSDPVTITDALITSDDDIVFIITDTGTAFTATLNTIPIIEDESIQNVINAIRTTANGEDCTIRFVGNGADPLAVGNNTITFNNTGGTWGEINLEGSFTGNTGNNLVTINDVTINSTASIANANTSTVISMQNGELNISGGTVRNTGTGRAILISGGLTTISGNAVVTSGNTDAAQGTIHINTSDDTDTRLSITGGAVRNSANNGNTINNQTNGGVSISGGEVSATTGGRAIRNTSSGAVTISGGEVKATSGWAIDSSTSSITVTGGEVTATTGVAIRSTSTGTITISGGTVSATTGRAIESTGSGAITVSQTGSVDTVISSTNGNTGQGTIHLNGGGNLSISGGLVRNTGTSGTAILNATTGDITISGGTVSATEAGAGGRAIFSNGGEITISQTYPAVDTLITSANTANTAGTIVLSGGGSLSIEGGTVGNTSSGTAIYNGTTGAITISGGEVSAGTGRAIFSNGLGLITVSDNALITSANTQTTQGTIHLNGGGGLEIRGGTVRHTGNTGNAIYNGTNGGITISGGKVEATLTADAYAVYSAGTGVLSIDWHNAEIIGKVHPEVEGDGTAASPYLVTQGNMRYVFADLAGNYQLTENVDLTGTGNWAPIGQTGAASFTGTFDGDGYTIKGLTIEAASATQSYGMFGMISGTVKNLGLVDVNINVDQAAGVSIVGGFAGQINTIGSVENCYVTGNISGNDSVGGIAGINNGTVTNSYANGNVSGNHQVGGIVGQNNIGTANVRNSYFIGNVIGNEYVGGIVGNNNNGTVTNCYTKGIVRGASSVGGIVGSGSGGAITNCVALNSSIERTSVSLTSFGRVRGSTGGTFTNNHALDTMTVAGEGVTGTSTDKNGAAVTATDAADVDWWTTAATGVGWIIHDEKTDADETSPWWWDDAEKSPRLWFE